MKFLLKRRVQKDEKIQLVNGSNTPRSPSSSASEVIGSRRISPDINQTSVRTSSPPAAPQSRRTRSPVRNTAAPPSPVLSSSSSSSLRQSSETPTTVVGVPLSPLLASQMAIGHISSRSTTPHGIEGSLSREDSVDECNPFTEIPLLRETPVSEQQEVFRRKLQACSVVYDFNQNTHLKAKEAKRQTLLELVEYVNNTRNCYVEPVMALLMHMISANIFRSLPPPSSMLIISGTAYDPEDDEPQLESIFVSAWPHLQIVYELFLRFVVCTEVDPKAAKRYIDQQFVLKLLDLFASEDPRERDYLKTILHRIYGKIMALRSFIRKAVQHVFSRFTYEYDYHKGISELLEILGSIINGFALPLKEEHKLFLERSLIPLHKAKSLSAFNQQLTYCMTQYVEKDSRLTEPIILGLLRFWPITNTNKEVVFLNELEEILELTQATEFQKVMCPLFKRLALCIQSPHFQVAERVLFLWNNEFIVTLFNNYKQQLFPLVISALYKNSKEHWNSTVHGLTYNVSKLLAEADPQLFDQCSDQNMMNEELKIKELEEKEKEWEKMEKAFQIKSK